MKRLLLLAACCAAAPAFAADTDSGGAVCAADPGRLVAHYQLPSPTAGGEPLALNVYRDGETVAWEYPDRGLADLWIRMPNGRLRMTRFFDAQRRAIEYQAGEVAARGASWERLWHVTAVALPPPDPRAPCDATATLATDAGRVRYRPAFALVSALAGSDGAPRLQLLSVNTDPAAAAFLERRGDYTNTDYADIGDNEHDPFLREMINLGFIHHHDAGHSH